MLRFTGRRAFTLAALTAALVWSCRGRRDPALSFSFDRDAGVVYRASARTCLSIRNGSLIPGDRVRIVDPSPPQSGPWEGRVSASDADCADSPSGDASLNGYRLQLDNPDSLGGPAIGMVHFEGAFRLENGVASADLDGDGRLEYFRACTTAEGVRLSLWSDRPVTGTLRWKQYHYLGYDVTPSCTPDESRP